MKKAFYFFLFLGCFSAKAQYVTLPDTNFVNWLKANGYNQCFNGFQLDTTCPAILNAVTLNCYSLIPDNVRNIEGVEYFKNLDTLNCYGDSLVNLPCLPPKLQILACNLNYLEILPSLPNTIHGLFCEFNMLTTLPKLPDSLERLTCHDNQITELPDFPKTLLSFFGEINNLTGLPELPDTMTYLECSGNPNLFCLPQLKKIGTFYFQSTGVACVPNYGQVTYSIPVVDSMPLCDSVNPHDCEFFTTGINEVQEIKLSIAPNPVTNILTGYTSTVPKNTTAIITATDGRTIQSVLIKQSYFEIDVSNLAAGIYFITLQNENDRVVRKFVKSP